MSSGAERGSGAMGASADAAADALVEGVLGGGRRALAQAITLAESSRADDRDRAEALLDALTPHAGGAIRIGISGAPGVGKSTFIEAHGRLLTDDAHRLAVLAVDPSSAIGGGAILADKTRMETLARNPRAYIRPSPSGTTLGGVARRTREAVVICEAAGFDVVIVETVGVGQSETAVAGMTDVFVLLLSPAGGDELQGIKRGIVELADVVLVTKADGELAGAALRAAGEYRHALDLLQPRLRGWQVPVLTCSALEGTGIEDAWRTIERCHAHLHDSGRLRERRTEQQRAWLWSEMSEQLLAAMRADPAAAARLAEVEQAVAAGDMPPAVAARRLVEAFLRRARD